MMNLENFTCEGYERVSREFLADVNSDGLVMRHKKSGARIVLLSNDDPNKVFGIVFRTTPSDSTGVPHIMEHSVLCGSKKYPVKDPMTEIEKGSLCTFINAFTSSDWTAYPVASCNDKDFRNLVDVYMDAVLNPLIYDRKEIFLQEGWRYELESPEAELGINGVVYSEMKGAFSSAERCVYRALKTAMFPDVTYGVESGGDPAVIPELTYEQFLEFHRTYYSPANSFIYLYGDLDMGEMLAHLDAEYLSKFDIIPVNSEIGIQKPVPFRRVDTTYPINADADEKGKTFLQYGVNTYAGPDVKKNVAWDVLSAMLFSMPGAPVRQALIDAGIGTDVYGYADTEMQQPLIVVTARESEPERADEFLSIVRSTVADIVKNGVNKRTIRALINRAKFSYRAADSSDDPKGLMYAFALMGYYLYDEKAVFDGFRLSGVFDELERDLDDGYFEKLLQEYLDSDYAALVVMRPEKGLGEKREKELAAKLAAKKASMSDEEIAAIVEQTAALREFQNREETEEELATIPTLALEDISKKPLPLEYTVKKTAEDVPVVHVDMFTGGITNLQARFDVTDLPEEELPYLRLLTYSFQRMDTEKYAFKEFLDEVNFYTGSLSVFAEATAIKGEIGDMKSFVTVDLRVFDGGVSKGFELLWEGLYHTKFDNRDRLREILMEQAAGMPSGMMSSGHGTANSLGFSHFSAVGRFRYLTTGEGYYAALCRWIADYDNCKDEIVAHMERIRSHYLRKERLTFGISADSDGYAKALPAFSELVSYLAEVTEPDVLADAAIVPKESYHFEKKNEVLTYAGAVQYASAVGNYRMAGYEYTGVYSVLRTILAQDYLWTKIRILGGAYGVMFNYDTVAGNLYMVTYRDPNLRESYEVFRESADYTENINLSERDLTRYIIGTIASQDYPFTATTSLFTAINRYFIGTTPEDIQKTRDEILGATNEQLRELAPMLRAVLAQGYRAALATESKAKECEDLFDVCRPLRS